MFQVGDRVVYQNTTISGIPKAVGVMGTVVAVYEEVEAIRVILDEPKWTSNSTKTDWVKGWWKWKLIKRETTQETIIRKCQDLTLRFKTKAIKTKSTPIPFPKDKKHA